MTGTGTTTQGPEFESSDEAARYVSHQYHAYYHDKYLNYCKHD